MRRLLLTVLTLAVGMTSVSTQTRAETLTLDDCIETALKNRLSIIRAQGEERLAAWDQRWALGQFLPRVDASYSFSKGEESDIDPPNERAVAFDDSIAVYVRGNDTARDLQVFPTEIQLSDQQDIGPNKNLNFSANMWLFNLPNLFNYLGARQSKVKAHLDVINSEQDLIFSVKSAYYAYLAAVENVEVQDQAVERSEEQLKLIESRFELGSASKSDVLKQRVQMGQDELSLLQAENAVVTTMATLAYTVGLDPNREDLEFSTEYNQREYEGSLDEAITFGTQHEPGLLATRKDLAASLQAVRSRWSEYLPKLSVFGDYTIFEGTQAFPTVFDYSFNRLTYGFRISLNIFDGFTRERNLAIARVNRNNARAAVAETRNLMTSNIKSAYYEITQQRQAKEVAQENVESAQEDLKITQEKYDLGAATILDLLDSQVSLKQTQVQLIQADFDLNLAVARLENAMGKM